MELTVLLRSRTIKKRRLQRNWYNFATYIHLTYSAKKGSCCSGIDIYDARRVAQKLDIPHYVFNYEKTFKEDVIDYFIQSYENGETPIPCVKCNETVKFRDLMNLQKN